MNIMPGYYKVSTGKRFNRSYHFVRVWIEDNQKYIQFDHGLPECITKDDEHWFVQDYTIEKEYSASQPIVIINPKIIFEFGESGAIHKLEARNWQVVEIILFPRLKKALGMK